jgi:phage-related protein
LTVYEFILIPSIDGEHRASDPPFTLGGIEQKELRLVSTTCAGYVGIRVVPRADGPAPALGETTQGIGGGIVELIEDFDGDTYRTVYTVRFQEAIYVLHAFKKKSKQGIATPKSDIDLIKRRLKDAVSDHAERFKEEQKP